MPRGWPGVLTAPRRGCSSDTLQGTAQGSGCAWDLRIFLGVGSTEELHPPEKAVGRRGERRGAVLGRAASRRARKVWGSVRGEGVRTPPGIAAGGRTPSPGAVLHPKSGRGTEGVLLLSAPSLLLVSPKPSHGPGPDPPPKPTHVPESDSP